MATITIGNFHRCIMAHKIVEATVMPEYEKITDVLDGISLFATVDYFMSNAAQIVAAQPFIQTTTTLANLTARPFADQEIYNQLMKNRPEESHLGPNDPIKSTFFRKRSEPREKISVKHGISLGSQRTASIPLNVKIENGDNLISTTCLRNEEYLERLTRIFAQATNHDVVPKLVENVKYLEEKGVFRPYGTLNLYAPLIVNRAKICLSNKNLPWEREVLIWAGRHFNEMRTHSFALYKVFNEATTVNHILGAIPAASYWLNSHHRGRVDAAASSFKRDNRAIKKLNLTGLEESLTWINDCLVTIQSEKALQDLKTRNS